MYRPSQIPPNLDTEGLRKWIAEELIRLSRVYQEDTVPFDPTTMQTDITALQSADTAINAKLAQADDVVSFAAGATALTTATALTLASGSVPIGTWDLYGHAFFGGGGATTSSDYQITIGTVANTVNTNLPDSWFERRTQVDWVQTAMCGPLRVVLGAATTYRLSARAVFSGGALSVSSLLYGRRVIV